MEAGWQLARNPSEVCSSCCRSESISLDKVGTGGQVGLTHHLVSCAAPAVHGAPTLLGRLHAKDFLF